MFIVLLPSLYNDIKIEKKNEIHNTQNRSLEFSLLISLPSAIGLYILSNPIIHILFERGAFVAEDTLYTAQVLSIFSIGLPAYILTKVLLTCFFAREDTKTPLYVSAVSVITNITLSLLLISTMREMGIALATATSAWVNAFLLFFILQYKKNIILDKAFLKNICKIIISVLAMLCGCYLLNELLYNNLANNTFLIEISNLLFIIVCCKIIYLTMIFMLKVVSLKDLKRYTKK
jgi:putative peptidoglycan lipid II flippase